MIINNLDFEKMHGLGNDYILINDMTWNIPEEKKSLVAKKLCKFHFSIGADGLIYICKSDKADIRMRIFNDDRSEAEMCGNGARCIARFAYLKGITGRECCFETLSGLVNAYIDEDKVKIKMKDPSFDLRRAITIPGYCDSCGEYEESLKQVNGEFLCSGCA